MMKRSKRILVRLAIALIVISIWTVGFLLRKQPNATETPAPPTSEAISETSQVKEQSQTKEPDSSQQQIPNEQKPESMEISEEATHIENAVEAPQASNSFDLEVEAYELSESFSIILSDGMPSDMLLDRNYTTKYTFRRESSIELIADEDIHSLYIIWDLPPGQWHISSEEGLTYGQDGFIHEYIKLSNPQSKLTMLLPESSATICDVYAFSEGTPPHWVQSWLPPLNEADMLVLPTHADDEHLFFVGVLPYYAGQRGYRVQVAYMTHHWTEPPRPHELLNGLWTVGIRNYPVISSFNDLYADSLQQAQSLYGFDSIVDFHVELLRRFKPRVVVGHDLNGEYGHGAHMLNAHTLRAAAELAADANYHEGSYSLYGAWDTPKLYLHLYADNSIIMDWDVPLEAFGGATARDMAIAGYDCHLSQHRWSFSVPRTNESLSGHMFGLVKTTVGPDLTGGDMFENIG